MTTFAEEVDAELHRLIAGKALGYDDDFEIKTKAKQAILNLVSERIIAGEIMLDDEFERVISDKLTPTDMQKVVGLVVRNQSNRLWEGKDKV